MKDVYAVFVYIPYLKGYDWSLISRDLASCETRYNEKLGNVLLIKTKKVYFKPVMSLDEIKKDFIILKEKI